MGMIHPIDNWLTLDEYGMRLPWYTRPCLEWLVTLDLRGKHVFEYGCGGSTWWYRSRGSKVVGVDHDLKWADMAGVYYSGGNKAFPKAAYLGPISDHIDPFDIIVVDGEYRDDCASEALNFLNPGGYLIIDNYLQPSVEPNTWDKFHAALDNVIGYTRMLYKEPSHQDWHTLVIQMP